MVDEDHCVYVKKLEEGIMFLSLYNIFLVGNNLEMISATKRWLFFVFKMKDIGEARFFLGVETIWKFSKRQLGVSQQG